MAFSNHDVRPDTPINNFATMNPLDFAKGTNKINIFSGGNLFVRNSAGSDYRYALSTIGGLTSGKWYWEYYFEDATSNTSFCSVGVITKQYTGGSAGRRMYNGYNANKYGSSGSGETYSGAAVFGSDHIIGCYLDLDSGIIEFFNNGVSQGIAFTDLIQDFSAGEYDQGWFPAMEAHNNRGTLNFGQDPTFSGNPTAPKIPTKVYTDSNGQGRFYYEPPAGALALCSRNIDTPKNVPSTYIVDETNTKMLAYNGNTEISKFSPYATDGYSVSIFSTNSFEIPIADVSFGTGDFSVEAWLYFRHDGSNDANILIDSRSALSQSNLVLGLDGTYRNPYWYYSGGNVALSNATGACIPDNWNHVLWQRTGGYLKMYSNGVEIKSDSNTSDLTGTGVNSRARIGNLVSSPNYAIDSLMTDFRIVKGGVAYNITGSTYTVPTSKLLSSQGSSNGEIYSGTCSFLLSVDSNTIKDSSSSPSAITINNTPSIEAWSPYTSIDKQTGFELPATTNGGSFSFDGNSNITIDANELLSLSTSQFTIEFWVYPRTNSSVAHVFGLTGAISISINANNTLYWIDSGTANYTKTSALTVKDNHWNHVAYCRDSSNNISIYINGVKDSTTWLDSTDYSSAAGASNYARIGSNVGNDNGTRLEGYISDFRIVKGTAVYTGSTFTPPSGKLTAITNTILLLQPFQPKSSVNSPVFNITDSYNKGEANKNLTYVGNPKVVDFSPYKGGSHGSFSVSGNDVLILDDSDDWDLGTSFTVECWFYGKGSTSTNLQYLMSKWENYKQYNWYFTSTSAPFGELKFEYDSGNNSFSDGGTFTTGMVANRWYHLAFVNNSGTTKLYINGVAVNQTGTIGNTVNLTTDKLRIFRNVDSNKGCNALITDFRIAKGKAVYTTNFTPPYDLLTTTGGTYASSAGINNPSTSETVLLLQPGKVADTDNEAAKDPDAFFKCVIWTGNETDDRQITTGFQPDLIWNKRRNVSTSDHQLHDSVRGITKVLKSNTNGTENTEPNAVKTVNSTGFTIGTDNNINKPTTTDYVAWCWKAGGAPSADGKIIKDGTESNISDLVTSTGASLTPTRISANTKAGFSIITYTSNQNSSSGSTDTLPHGLTFAPEIIIIKQLNNNLDWMVWHKSLSTNYNLNLNSTSKEFSVAAGGIRTPNASTIDIGGSLAINSSWTSTPQLYVCYAWHSVPGYSAIGAYTGDGNADGPFVYTGFKPALVILKVYNYTTTTYTSWGLYDNTRPSGTYNPVHSPLWANLSDVEGNRGNGGGGGNSIFVDFLSNGFKIRSGHTENNSNPNGIIYMAFAELPSSFARGR